MNCDDICMIVTSLRIMSHYESISYDRRQIFGRLVMTRGQACNAECPTRTTLASPGAANGYPWHPMAGWETPSGLMARSSVKV